MSDHITILDSIFVTVVSMIVVFAVLVLIAYLINALKVISNGNKKDASVEASKTSSNIEAAKTNNSLEDKGIVTTSEDEIDEELVAVIAAAVAANLGLNIPDIRINSIRRVPQMNSSWAQAAKRDNLINI